MKFQFSMLCVLFVLSAMACSGCEKQSEYALDECTPGNRKCEYDYIYVCRDDGGTGFWGLEYVCQAGCDNVNSCKCPEKCVNGCDQNGHCLLCPEGESDCQNDCANGFEADGRCRPDVYTILPSKYVLTLFDTAEEIEISVLKNGKNFETAANVTLKLEVMLRNENCAEVSLASNKLDGHYKLTVMPKESTNVASCSTTLVLQWIEDDTTDHVAEVELSIMAFYDDNTDANGNHLKDKYDKVLGTVACQRHTDCDSEPGAGEGLCDSMLHNTCSTRCTKNEECIQDEANSYVCRSDGRCMQRDLVTSWAMPANTELVLPHDANSICNFDVDWGDGIDGKMEHISTCDEARHTYASEGEYTVTIRGQYEGWTFVTGFAEDGTPELSDAAKYLRKVERFGSVKLGEYAFAGTGEIKLSREDIPDLNDASLKGAFYQSSYNENVIMNWDMSRVQDVSHMFYGAEAFDQPLAWNTSNVTNMSHMFCGAEKFNQPLAWDTSSVTDMSYMFAKRNKSMFFNSDIGSWNTSKVKTMEGMFSGANNFNANISSWNTSSVTNMSRMFENAKSFNRPLAWNTSSVTNMSRMFYGALAFNQSLEWNTSNVTDMSYMFAVERATMQFNGDISGWDTSKVQTMERMFSYTIYFNQPIQNWDTSSVTNMMSMFSHAYKFNQPLNTDGNRWNVSKVTTMASMFEDATAFNQYLSDWELNENVDCTGMFVRSGIDKANACKMSKDYSQFAEPLASLIDNCE